MSNLYTAMYYDTDIQCMCDSVPLSEVVTNDNQTFTFRTQITCMTVLPMFLIMVVASCRYFDFVRLKKVHGQSRTRETVYKDKTNHTTLHHQ